MKTIFELNNVKPAPNLFQFTITQVSCNVVSGIFIHLLTRYRSPEASFPGFTLCLIQFLPGLANIDDVTVVTEQMNICYAYILTFLIESRDDPTDIRSFQKQKSVPFECW